MKLRGLLCVWLLVSVTQAFAQNADKKGTFSGRVYSDIYYMLSNHNEDLEGQNGIRFRRIYATYEYTFTDAVSTRLRLEMDNVGDFTTAEKMAPVVKDAYLKWDTGQHAFYAGIAGSPTWGVVEDVWGYRSMEKTPLDLQGLGSSRDFGLAAKGVLDNSGRLNYHAMIGNGNSNSSESDKGKKMMLSLSYQLTGQLVIEAYGDYESRDGTDDVYTWQGFMAYQSDALVVGGMYAAQSNTGNNADVLDIASAFTHFKLGDKTKGVLRVDHMFSPNPAGSGIDYLPFSPIAESTLLIAGVDIQPIQNVHIMPNVETVFYTNTEPANVEDPATDIQPRLTLFYRF